MSDLAMQSMHTGGWSPDGLTVEYGPSGNIAAQLRCMSPLTGWLADVYAPSGKLAATFQINVNGPEGANLARALCDIALGHEAGRWYAEGNSVDMVHARNGYEATVRAGKGTLHKVPVGGAVRARLYRSLA